MSSWGPDGSCGGLSDRVHHRHHRHARPRKLRLEGIIPSVVERIAVIDMGSNSWRLVVFGYEPGTRWWSLVDEIREAVRDRRRDGRDEASASAAGADGARACTRPPCSRPSAAPPGVSRSRPWPPARSATPSTATSCSTAIERTTGLEARVISGEEEARYGYLAIANSTTIEDGFGIDIGGGSVQTLRIEGPPAGRVGLAPARRRARERALPARTRRRPPSRSRRCARTWRSELERARLVGRRRPPGRDRRHDPQPRRRGA